MNGKTMTCPHCGEPIAPGSRFCEWCGKPVSQQETPREPQRLERSAAPPPPPPPPAAQAASRPPSSAPKGRRALLIGLIAGGALLTCLLVVGGAVLLLRGGLEAEPVPPTGAPPTRTVVPPTDAPAPTATVQPVESAPAEPTEAPATVVEAFVKATLGTVPGAAIDYDRARSLMTAAYAAQFDSPSFVPLTYGIQDGPEGVEMVSEDVSGATATVVAQGYWGGEPGTPWAFTLQQEGGAWRIGAIDAQPVSGIDAASGAVPGAVEALLGEWEVVEGEGSDAGERFRILWETERGLRVRWLDEFSDIEGIEDLERFYLELENQGGGRWTGVAVSVYWDPETDQVTEEGREPVVLILSDGDQQLLIGPPESEGFIARRVDGS